MCVIPWTNLMVRPDGTAHFCCDVLEPLRIGDRDGNVARDSLDELWNAEQLVSVRSAMARGEKPPDCHVCWKREAEGGVSRRQGINPAYRGLGGTLPIESLGEVGAATGYRLERKPDWFVLELGNVCNLRCRSCTPVSSSRIAADRVQRSWMPEAVPPGSGSTAWFRQIDKMADDIASGAGENAILSLMGGEPFLIEHTWSLLEALVARGVASKIFVGLSTNGQQTHPKLAELAPLFRGFNTSISIDGTGKLYDYLRSGGTWPKLVETVEQLMEVPNLQVSVVPTFQNANVLDISEVVRFADERGLALAYNILLAPARLGATNLPPSVRRIAASRLRAHLDGECSAANAPILQAYCEVLEEPGDAFDAELFEEFMTFTNDLDADRGENFRDAAPELFALIRAAGIEWSHKRRHGNAEAAGSSFEPSELLQRVNRTVSPNDIIYTAGVAAAGQNWYFQSAADQIAEIDAQLRAADHPGLAGCAAVADFASHYGRMTRVLRAALPHAAVYACDIDAAAIRFCAEELGALPVLNGWRPDEEALPEGLGAVVCVSLLTHTTLDHWRRVLRAWSRMLRPGGVAAFTYLSDRFLQPWLAGEMPVYGVYSDAERDAVVAAVERDGFGFSALPLSYGEERSYGITFATPEVLRREVAGAGLELLPVAPEASRGFGQDLVLVRKPSSSNGKPHAVPLPRRDVSVVAFFDPRCYAPSDPREGDVRNSMWAQMLADSWRKPLPTEIGFADPRVHEVREEQASLAAAHGVDAFCWLYSCGPEGPRWDAPFRELVASGRPAAAFCVMLAPEEGASLDAASAAQAFDGVTAALQDARYLRVDGKPLVFVRDLERFSQPPRRLAAAWRAAASKLGVGEVHLCAVLPTLADTPDELGFDSFLAPPWTAATTEETVAEELAKPWPQHRIFRRVGLRRSSADYGVIESYELVLQATLEATRSRGEPLVFLDAWNDWSRGAYLEPDDADGRAALMATKRATRGPASGLVLWRRLRDALGHVDEPAASVLNELRGVLSAHEHARDRLLATVEVAVGRTHGNKEPLHRIALPVGQFAPSKGRVQIDEVGEMLFPYSPEMIERERLVLQRQDVRFKGWAYSGDCAPEVVDVFLVFEGEQDYVFRAGPRIERLDVSRALPGYPENSGFDISINLKDVPAGAYRVTVVQVTPLAAYRDETGIVVERSEAACLNG
jgi:MoaA/NifB/PqqE/SkfB family radical SAM enzyme/SAM-dependent methyltransferase